MQQNGVSALSREELDLAFGSFAGMEGGNPGAAVWVCDAAPLYSVVPLPMALQPQWLPGTWDAAFRRRHADVLPRWQTHMRIARIMAAARATAMPPGRSPIGAQAYFDHYLYAPGGWEFKLNLFPLPERLDATQPWTKVFSDQTVLRSRSEFFRLCRHGARFRFIEALRRQHRPRVVLCLGERLERDYLRAFGFQDVQGTDAILKPADMPRHLQIFQHEQTTLVLSPALGGAQGLSSDVLLDSLGEFLAQWLRAADFPPSLEGVVGPAAGRLAGTVQRAAPGLDLIRSAMAA